MNAIYRIPAALRKGFFTILLGLTFLCGLSAPAGAADIDAAAFTVQDVKVDVTAADSAAAREQAFTQAQQAAFQQLAERLLSEDELKTFTPPAPEAISGFINDFEITEEHLSAVRYIGTFTFRFKSTDVRRFIGGKGLTYTDVSSKPVLILPFYQWGSRTVLWGANNPWLAAWSRDSGKSRGLVPVAVPIGDAQDVSDIADDKALTYDPAHLGAMAARYKAGETFILLAAPAWGPGSTQANQAPDAISITVYKAAETGPAYLNTLSIKTQSGDTQDILFDRAAAEVREEIQKNWKQKTLVNPEERNNLSARIKFSSMPQWVETQAALQKVQGINSVRLISLKPNEAYVELMFQGGEQRLRLALSQADMTLTTPQVDFTQTQVVGTSPLIYDLYLNKFSSGSQKTATP